MGLVSDRAVPSNSTRAIEGQAHLRILPGDVSISPKRKVLAVAIGEGNEAHEARPSPGVVGFGCEVRLVGITIILSR